VTPKMRLALETLRDGDGDGDGDGVDCSTFGAVVMPDRAGRRASANGGGDYAAQMYLGRLRKLGLARVLPGEGSSKWALTSAGRAKLAEVTSCEIPREIATKVKSDGAVHHAK
jgi:hypothetical protein